ncbi:MAG: hypothetical protein QW594_00690 [Candidatus Woesearchaeota archaeon]
MKVLPTSMALLMVVAMVLLAGCQSQQQQSGSPYLGGTTGLQFAFSPDAPPNEIYDSGGFPFDIDVIIKNIGEYTVPKEKAVIRIKGIYPQDYGKTAQDLVKSPVDDLTGAKKDITGRTLPGIESHVTFENLNYQGQISGTLINVLISAEACYEYKTLTTVSLCIREDMRTNTAGVCTVTAPKTTYNSGAPIHIENFNEVAVSSNKISFTFDIVHKNNGKYFDPNSDCEENFQNQDKVFVSIETGFADTQCSGLTGGDGKSGIVRVPAGKGSVRCTMTVDETQKGDYEKPITITTTYKYKDKIDKTIVLKHGGN